MDHQPILHQVRRAIQQAPGPDGAVQLLKYTYMAGFSENLSY